MNSKVTQMSDAAATRLWDLQDSESKVRVENPKLEHIHLLLTGTDITPGEVITHISNNYRYIDDATGLPVSIEEADESIQYAVDTAEDSLREARDELINCLHGYNMWDTVSEYMVARQTAAKKLCALENVVDSN